MIKLTEEKNPTKANSNNKKQEDFVPTDGGVHAWVVMVCCFIINGLFYGVVDSYGQLYVHLTEKYHDDPNVAMKVSLG